MRSVTNKWSTWITIDPTNRLTVPIVWKEMSSGDHATRMICGTCRVETSKKCNQEGACESERLKVLEDSESSDFCEEDED